MQAEASLMLFAARRGSGYMQRSEKREGYGAKTPNGKRPKRSGFGAGLLEAGRRDDRVLALTADLKGSLKMDAFAA